MPAFVTRRAGTSRHRRPGSRRSSLKRAHARRKPLVLFEMTDTSQALAFLERVECDGLVIAVRQFRVAVVAHAARSPYAARLDRHCLPASVHRPDRAADPILR